MLRETILGINVDNVSQREAISRLHLAVIQRKGAVVCTAPPHSIVESMNDAEFKEALNNADMVLPDGIGVVLASRMLRGGIKERVTGPDMFYNFTKHMNDNGGCKYYFYGSTKETLLLISERMHREFPNIQVVGLTSPPFGDISEENNNENIGVINRSSADVLWVGMTAPKQEKWIYRNKDKLNVALVGAVGAAFDFYAGTKRRCPEYLRKIGLEWLVRCILEPRRLFKRVIISNPKFICLVFKDMLKRI